MTAGSAGLNRRGAPVRRARFSRATARAKPLVERDHDVMPGRYLAVLLLLGMHGLPSSSARAGAPEFADPAFKGMPFPFDHRAIPAAYHGIWTGKPADCRRAAKQLRITRTTLGGQRIGALHGYSDHPAIFVRLRHARNRGLGIELDISQDGRWLRRSDGYGSEPILLQRCPD